MVNPLWPSDAIWWHWSWLTFFFFKYCLVAWQPQAITWTNIDLSFVINEFLWLLPDSNFTGSAQDVNYIHSLTPRKFELNSRKVLFKLNLKIDWWGISCEIVLRWMSLDLTGNESTLVQVMAWCRQATNHYLSQCWPRSVSPYGITRPQWVKEFENHTFFKNNSTSSRSQWVNICTHCCISLPAHSSTIGRFSKLPPDGSESLVWNCFCLLHQRNKFFWCKYNSNPFSPYVGSLTT